MRRRFIAVLIAVVMSIGGCASIPPEAPELSAQLGSRISSLEAAHVRLLQEFFSEKRRRVDDFVQEVWVPIFAQEFFGDPRVDAVWQQVVQSQDPKDRLKFITLVGPKLQDRLPDIAPGMQLTTDYGILTPISGPLFWVLSKFHALTGNWGFAIILLTLLVKGAMYKLSEAQYRSMAKMKKFAPRIADIRERYSENREALQKAMMDLYKKEGFNPLAGCWPLLLQFPVFIALYWVLLESVELRQAPFILWIDDLALPDPWFVLPVLFGISMWVQQKISGQQMMDPTQQKIMMVMPIMLAAFFTFFQSGLVLYWLTSNLIGIAQQWYITRKLEREDAAKAAARR